MSTTSEFDSSLELIVVPRTHELVENFEVRRALPTRQRRMVGPFIFFDQMGPHTFNSGSGLDIEPHPHIGLSTVTYLYEGSLLHRDSTGSVQTIQPGDVNWMTAGRGIVHSERTGPDIRQQESPLLGIQCWVALPQAYEEKAPDFHHSNQNTLPLLEDRGVKARVIAGRFSGQKSPVPTLSELIQVDILLKPGARLDIPAEYPEQAIYIVQGTLDLGRDGVFNAGQLLVLKEGRGLTLAVSGIDDVRLMLVGGEPMDSPRYISWNFVSSSAERIEQAKDDWRNQRFESVPEESGFIPMPDIPSKPTRHP